MTSSWAEVSLADVCDVFDGPHATPVKTAVGPLFLGISNLNGGRLELREAEHLSEEDFTRWTRRVSPRTDDVVFSYETRLGEAALIPPSIRCCLGRRMGLLRPDLTKINPRFLLYSYLSPSFQETLRQRTVHGSTVDRIPLIELPDFPIRVAPRNEQDRIAEILGALDDKIELNRRMNETLEAMARAIFNSSCIHYETDDLPAAWSRRSIKAVASNIQYGLTQAATNEPVGPRFLRITDIRGGYVTWSSVPYCRVPDVEVDKYIVKDGDIFVARTGASTGENFYAVTPPRSVFASYLVRFQFENPGVARLVAEFMRTPSYRDYIAGVVGGSAQPNASAQRLADVELTIPDENTIKEFYDAVRPLDERRAANSAECDMLAGIRDAVLPELLNGGLMRGESR